MTSSLRLPRIVLSTFAGLVVQFGLSLSSVMVPNGLPYASCASGSVSTALPFLLIGRPKDQGLGMLAPWVPHPRAHKPQHPPCRTQTRQPSRCQIPTPCISNPTSTAKMGTRTCERRLEPCQIPHPWAHEPGTHLI